MATSSSTSVNGETSPPKSRIPKKENELDAIKTMLNALSETLEANFAQLEEKLDALDERLGTIEEKMATTSTQQPQIVLNAPGFRPFKRGGRGGGNGGGRGTYIRGGFPRVG